MSAEYTPEMIAMLERQREYFCSDDHIRREVEPWRDATPEQRLADLAEMCRDSQFFLNRLNRLDPAALERALQRDPLPADSEEIFLALRRR